MLQAAALRYLARYAATEAGLAQVLQRKVDRWARQAEADQDAIEHVTRQARAEIAALVGRLAASGAISDADFARSRARSLARAGRSRRAIGAHLSSRGVPGALAASASPPDPSQELAAALIHARKRRMGPWRRKDATPELLRRELASLARGGFQHGVAARALKFDIDEAEQVIIDFRAAL
jgi:regulatory protein